MDFEIKELVHCADKLRSDKIPERKKIRAMKVLLDRRVTVSQLEKSKIGKAVKKLVKKDGEVKEIADLLISKWKKEIADYCENNKNTTIETSNTNNDVSEPIKPNHKPAEPMVKQRNNFIPPIMKTSPTDFDSSNDNSINPFPDLPILPVIDTNSLSVSQEMWSTQPIKDANITVPKDESNLTSRYESQKRIWIPKSKTVANIVDDRDKEYINGVACDEIAMYDWKKLKNFENDDKKIMKKTAKYWENLFRSNHKSAVKREDETWRSAYMRVESEMEAKFQRLAAKINEKNRSQIKAQPQAKVLKGPLIPQNNKKRRRF